MSISEKFSTFCNNLRMEQEVIDNIKYKYERITQRLNIDYWATDSIIYHSLYVGSYERGTAIHISDIDMLFQLPYEVYERFNKYRNKQSSLLQEVKEVIEKIVKSNIRADGQVIKINFTDGIFFELVPCFINTDGSYTYPDTNFCGSWKTTKPKPEIYEINSANNNWNKNLKRLRGMARA